MAVDLTNPTINPEGQESIENQQNALDTGKTGEIPQKVERGVGSNSAYLTSDEIDKQASAPTEEELRTTLPPIEKFHSPLGFKSPFTPDSTEFWAQVAEAVTQ